MTLLLYFLINTRFLEQYLGITEDLEDDFTYIVEMIQNSKKMKLTKSVMQKQYLVVSYPSQIFIKYCLIVLFDPLISRKQEASNINKMNKYYKLNKANKKDNSVSQLLCI